MEMRGLAVPRLDEQYVARSLSDSIFLAMKELIKKWHGESVVISFHQPTGTWIFIAIHSTVLGRAVGGCRMREYESPEDGLLDAMRLAEGMTYKWAAAGMEFGGGKSVLAVTGHLDLPNRAGVLRRLGRLIDSLCGAYSTGEDLGTTPEDMAIVAEQTQWVHGIHPGARAVDPGPYTALGVFVGIRAAVRHVLGSGDLTGRTVVIQGVGDVGEPLARLLLAAGAEVIVCDLDEGLARRVSSELDVEAVVPHLVYARMCDVFAPCAVGATLNSETIPQLQCRIVAGAANNQLAEPRDADRLLGRGILYAPDYVINAGGAIALPSLDSGIVTKEQVEERIQGIEPRLLEIFAEASLNGESPHYAAQRMVERMLVGKRGA
jgi:leucine dehydrogenase